MENQNNKQNYKDNERSCVNKFISAWITFILFLIVIMTIVVTYDRYVFHKRIYELAYADISSPKCEQGKHVVDTLNTSVDFSILNIFDVQSTNDKVESVLYFLSKSDGLLGSNGLTFLVTLVVALLAALLLFRVEGDETIKERIRKAQIKAKQLNKNVKFLRDEADKENKAIECLRKEAEEKKRDIEELKNEAENLKNRVLSITDEAEKLKEGLDKSIRETSLTYEHITKHNRLLTLNESFYNLSIMIGNVVSSLSISRNDKENDAIALEVGNLCSRLSLFCDQIDDLLSDCEQRLDYLTRDEHYILTSYIDDALSGLNKSMKCIKDLKNDTLQSIINEKILIVEDIKEKIDSMRRGKEHK